MYCTRICISTNISKGPNKLGVTGWGLVVRVLEEKADGKP